MALAVQADPAATPEVPVVRVPNLAVRLVQGAVAVAAMQQMQLAALVGTTVAAAVALQEGVLRQVRCRPVVPAAPACASSPILRHERDARNLAVRAPGARTATTGAANNHSRRANLVIASVVAPHPRNHAQCRIDLPPPRGGERPDRRAEPAGLCRARAFPACICPTKRWSPSTAVRTRTSRANFRSGSFAPLVGGLRPWFRRAPFFLTRKFHYLSTVKTRRLSSAT